eukprot:366225-Chlamydomonas_euryale.AAC.12
MAPSWLICDCAGAAGAAAVAAAALPNRHPSSPSGRSMRNQGPSRPSKPVTGKRATAGGNQQIIAPLPPFPGPPPLVYIHARGGMVASYCAYVCNCGLRLYTLGVLPTLVRRALAAAAPSLQALLEACAQAEVRKDGQRPHSQPTSGDVSAGTVDAAAPSSGAEAAQASGGVPRAAPAMTAACVSPLQSGCGRPDVHALQLYASPLQHRLKHAVPLPPKKVMYLPSTFVEGCLQMREPLLDCWLAVDLNGVQMVRASNMQAYLGRGRGNVYALLPVDKGGGCASGGNGG